MLYFTVHLKTSKMGRKPIKDKAIPVTVYVAKSVVKANGGIVKAREKAKEWLESIIETDK